jgi:hypothetical protein
MGAKLRRAITANLVVLMAVFFVIYLAPVPDLKVATALAPVMSPHALNALVVAGNSVVTNLSACDQDRRKLPSLLSEGLHKKVIDFSFPGQTVGQGLDYTTFALRRPHAGAAVFFLSPTLSSRSIPDLQTQMFFRFAASPEYEENSLQQRFKPDAPLLGPLTSHAEPFTYKNVRYPDYDGIKDIYYSAEKAAMGCPETLGKNRQFIEAFYWYTYVSQPVQNGNIAGLGKLQEISNSVHKRVLFVLMPVDYDDVQSMNYALAQTIRTRVRSTSEALKKENLNLLDLTEILPADGFADRWCACGHLSESGRRTLSERVVQALQTSTESENHTRTEEN